MSLWRGDSGRNSAARPALRKRRSECRFCRIQEPASGKSGRLGLALGTSELRQCPSWRRRAGSARVGGDEATASRGEPTAADRGLWRPSAGLRAYARPSVRARNSMAQQTATTAVGLELGSEDRLDEAIGFDGERSRDPPSWRDRNATPGPVVAACCLGAERSSDPGRREPAHRTCDPFRAQSPGGPPSRSRNTASSTRSSQPQPLDAWHCASALGGVSEGRPARMQSCGKRRGAMIGVIQMSPLRKLGGRRPECKSSRAEPGHTRLDLGECGRDRAFPLVLVFSVVEHVALGRAAGGHAISRRLASRSLWRTGRRRTVHVPRVRALVRFPMGVRGPCRLLAGVPPGG